MLQGGGVVKTATGVCLCAGAACCWKSFPFAPATCKVEDSFVINLLHMPSLVLATPDLTIANGLSELVAGLVSLSRQYLISCPSTQYRGIRSQVLYLQWPLGPYAVIVGYLEPLGSRRPSQSPGSEKRARRTPGQKPWNSTPETRQGWSADGKNTGMKSMVQIKVQVPL